MNYITLSDIKLQCRIDSTDTSEDTILTAYGNAAENMVQHYVRQSFSKIEDEEGDLPDDIRVAMLMLVANLYKNREPVTQVSVNIVPFTIRCLLDPYVYSYTDKVLTDNNDEGGIGDTDTDAEEGE